MNTKLRLLPSPLEVKKKKLCLSSSNLLETQNRLSGTLSQCTSMQFLVIKLVAKACVCPSAGYTVKVL